ncbi:MAG TPA: hypothetical protein VL360_07780 [Gammaproteobacteria bacterium]|nr:hypothetical protein [Gammaproteobacteria bacterium]
MHGRVYFGYDPYCNSGYNSNQCYQSTYTQNPNCFFNRPVCTPIPAPVVYVDPHHHHHMDHHHGPFHHHKHW